MISLYVLHEGRGHVLKSVHMLGDGSALLCRDETYIKIDFKWVQTIFPVLIFVLFEGVRMFSPLCPLNVTVSHIIQHFAAPGQTYTILFFPWSTWCNYENRNFAQPLSHNTEDSLRRAVTGSSGQTSKPFTWWSEQPRDKAFDNRKLLLYVHKLRIKDGLVPSIGGRV